MIMQKGLKCSYRGIFIIGDGIHTREELYQQKIAVDDTQKETKTDIPTSEIALESEPKPEPKPKSKKRKAKKKEG